MPGGLGARIRKEGFEMMRWMLLPVLAALLLFAATASARPIDPPVQVVIVVPDVYPSYVTPEQAEPVVVQWLSEVQAWYVAQVGKTFDYILTIHHTSLPMIQDQDDCGEGVNDNQVGLLLGELGMSRAGNRVWFVVLGGGGWAGGFWQSGIDYGQMIVGDWALAYDATGQHVPCDPYSSQGSGAFGHEGLHAMGADADNPAVFTGYTLTAAQKRDLLHHSKYFLRNP